jgi:LmbE family N-acetylglucosaminyl deacetylase
VCLTIAIHHPHPDHVDDNTASMRRVREATGDPAGLVDFRAWRSTDGTTLAGVATWEDELLTFEEL